jgi:hypothetical protein
MEFRTRDSLVDSDVSGIFVGKSGDAHNQKLERPHLFPEHSKIPLRKRRSIETNPLVD